MQLITINLYTIIGISGIIYYKYKRFKGLERGSSVMKNKIINVFLGIAILFIIFIAFVTYDHNETIDAVTGATPTNEVMDAISGASDDGDDD